MEGLAIAGTKEQRLNEDITYDQIRLVSDTGEQLGIVSPDEARTIAEERGMDLVEIAPNAEPPVCRLMDWGKHLYANAKKKQESKKKQKQITVKEIKFRPGTDVGDYDIKVRNLTRFLDAGNVPDIHEYDKLPSDILPDKRLIRRLMALDHAMDHRDLYIEKIRRCLGEARQLIAKTGKRLFRHGPLTRYPDNFN